MILNMAGPEHGYWLARLVHPGKNPNVLGYAPDTTLRVFRYAVPLTGIANSDAGPLIGHSDFGLTSSDSRDPVNELIGRLTEKVDEESWSVRVPKVFGTVVAGTPLEAETHALGRARFAADLITFALQTGASHFDTLHDSERLDWDAVLSKSTVSIRPWLLLFEEKTLKGWVRPIPLTFTDANAELGAARGRVQTFLNRFQRIAREGDTTDRLQSGLRTERERRTAKAVQTAVHWLSEAARTSDEEYQLLPVWTALEAVLGAIKYPPVFGSGRENIKRVLLGAIARIEEGAEESDGPRLSKELLRNRLLDNTWPVRTRLEVFAKAFGIRLHKGDTKLVRRLSRGRGQAVHTGGNATDDLSCEVAQLKYLVERLIMGASVCGISGEDEAGAMNPLHENLKIGTLGELLVQLRLLQYDVQAAAPLKDSGNDLIAVKGRVIKAIQVKTTSEGGKFGRARPEHYDLVAFVELRGAGREVNLEDSAVYLMPSERDERRARVESEEWRIGAELIERLFSGDVE